MPPSAPASAGPAELSPGFPAAASAERWIRHRQKDGSFGPTNWARANSAIAAAAPALRENSRTGASPWKPAKVANSGWNPRGNPRARVASTAAAAAPDEPSVVGENAASPRPPTLAREPSELRRGLAVAARSNHTRSEGGPLSGFDRRRPPTAWCAGVGAGRPPGKAPCRAPACARDVQPSELRRDLAVAAPSSDQRSESGSFSGSTADDLQGSSRAAAAPALRENSRTGANQPE
jgi:hypothetical protein